jgi:hypothetical protein
VTYSTPAAYVAAKAGEGLVWEAKSGDDFFPYADCAHCYWTGYFSSRPALKRLERQAAGFLQTLKQLTASALPAYDEGAAGAVTALTQAVGYGNHHDAVTGTARQVRGCTHVGCEPRIAPRTNPHSPRLPPPRLPPYCR